MHMLPRTCAGDGRSLTGPYCRVCDVSDGNVSDGSHYYDADLSECVPCGDTAATSLAALVGITLAVFFLLCWCSWRQPCKRLRIMAHQALPKIRAPLKQMVAFYQVREAPTMHSCTHSFTLLVDALPVLRRL